MLFVFLAATHLALGGNRASGAIVWLAFMVGLLLAVAITVGWFDRLAPRDWAGR